MAIIEEQKVLTGDLNKSKDQLQLKIAEAIAHT